MVLDGGAARLARADAFRQLLRPQPSEQLLIRCPHTPPPLQFIPELQQGYDTATQITALALWLRERRSPPPRRLWIPTDPEHTARITLLPGLRHLALDRAVYWFRPRSEQREIQILAVFFGGAKSSASDVGAPPAKKLRQLIPLPLVQERVIAAAMVFGAQRVRDVMVLLEAGGRMT